MFQIFTCHISIPFKFDTSILALRHFYVNVLNVEFNKLSRNSYLFTAFSHNPLVFNTKKTLETTTSIISKVFHSNYFNTFFKYCPVKLPLT